MEKITQKVTKNGKILKILSENLQKYKYSALEKALRNKDILLNGKRIKQNENVKIWDEITIFLDENSQKDLYKIFWEDKNFIVFDKMQGIEVCDGEYNLCSEYFSKTGKQIFPIHRIDRNTMGLVMFAKSKDMQNKMIELFKLGCVTKNYYAIVTGEPKESDILQGYLKKDSELIQVKIFDKKVQGSVFVETRYIMQKKLRRSKTSFC
jgi:23S rRNA-/tRNA-specific pseudouridylate synthase